MLYEIWEKSVALLLADSRTCLKYCCSVVFCYNPQNVNQKKVKMGGGGTCVKGFHIQTLLPWPLETIYGILK